MKDRTREAVFNLLGTAVKDKHTIDLFAGTGALGLEAISRGAASATLIEQHIPTARVVEQNAAALGVEDQTEVYAGDMFFWVRNLPKSKCIPVDAPWLVFSSPPYDFYVERRGDMLSAIGTLVELSPPGSIFVVEADERFDMAQLPLADDWDVRHYAPAVVGILEKT